RLLRIAGPAERGDGEEVAGPLQPPPRIAPVTGMPRHRGHGQRVQRLQQQGPDPADEHRRVPVHAADRAALREPALAARVDHLAARRALRPGHPLEDGPADPAADAADATFQVTRTLTAHLPIIPRPRVAAPGPLGPPGTSRMPGCKSGALLSACPG